MKVDESKATLTLILYGETEKEDETNSLRIVGSLLQLNVKMLMKKV